MPVVRQVTRRQATGDPKSAPELGTTLFGSKTTYSYRSAGGYHNSRNRHACPPLSENRVVPPPTTVLPPHAEATPSPDNRTPSLFPRLLPLLPPELFAPAEITPFPALTLLPPAPGTVPGEAHAPATAGFPLFSLLFSTVTAAADAARLVPLLELAAKVAPPPKAPLGTVVPVPATPPLLFPPTTRGFLSPPPALALAPPPPAEFAVIIFFTADARARRCLFFPFPSKRPTARLPPLVLARSATAGVRRAYGAW